jgi:hypothetical protein
MRLDIKPYTDELSRPVAEFNRRLGDVDVPFRIPESPPFRRTPAVQERLYRESFLAVESGRVRGGYTLKHQDFSFEGRVRSVGFYQNPISEGIVDNRFLLVGARLVNDAMRRQPLLYDLGIGSLDANIAKMHQAMGWRVRLLPFYFKVLNGYQFLRNLEYFKTNRLRRSVLDAAAYSGIGWAGAKLADALMTVRNGHLHGVTMETVLEFGPWADELWSECAPRYSMAAVRRSDVLNALYPPSQERYIRVMVRRGGRAAGWAVLLDTVMNQDKYFGSMRVGSIVDCMALPGDAPTVIYAAAGVLERRGVDLMVSNQSHPVWGRGLKEAGFLDGASNFVFATSPALTQLLEEIDPTGAGIHLTRGDGDGPIHL